LIRRGRDRRFHVDQYRRLILLKYCQSILGGRYMLVEYRFIKGKSKASRFWAFKAYIDGIYMKLIVRQLEKGSKEFFSIFPIKH